MPAIPLLSVALSADYPGKPGVLRNLCLQVRHGETIGLVGQSGCGKSTLALAIMRLLHLKGGTIKGTIQFQGHDLMRLGEGELRKIRGRDIGLVLQSPMSSLNPALRIGTQLAEGWRVHARGSRQECRQAVAEALQRVSLPATDDFLRRYPSQISVGQAQRVLIAMAVLHCPTLLIADEPTSALDPITAAETLRLFRRLTIDLGMALLYISHDLLSVATISNRIAVVHEGQIVECDTPRAVFTHPSHSYTRALLSSLPRPDINIFSGYHAVHSPVEP